MSQPNKNIITDISVQVRNRNRVNVSINAKYRLSLDISQVVDLGVKIGRVLTDDEMAKLEEEGQFGKLYARALEYCLSRPHSVREVRDYLYKKTLVRQVKVRGRNEVRQVPGVSPAVAERVLEQLLEKGHVNDVHFASWWAENRKRRQGISRKKLQVELAGKGVARDIIEQALSATERSDLSEIKKIIIKKQSRYPDEQKMVAYLARQGFNYSDIRQVLDEFAN